jgi:hypothetical protein
MAYHEAAHAVVSRLVGVLVDSMEVTQWFVKDRILHLASETACSHCNNLPDSWDRADWRVKSLIKRAGRIAEARHCRGAGRIPSEPWDDDGQIQWLFKQYAGKGDPNADGKDQFEGFLTCIFILSSY